MNNLDCSFGPVSSMPGSRHNVAPGSMCDSHPTVKAVARIQGETDSMGCEYVLMCQECLDQYSAHTKKQRESLHYCDWCSSLKTGVAPTRDYDEGSAGPIYQVCTDCRTAYASSYQDDDRLEDRFDDYLDDLPDDPINFEDYDEGSYYDPSDSSR